MRTVWFYFQCEKQDKNKAEMKNVILQKLINQFNYLITFYKLLLSLRIFIDLWEPLSRVVSFILLKQKLESGCAYSKRSLRVLSDNESRDINKLEVDWFICSFIFALLENTSLHNGK